jgi:hypothetical protein
MSTATAAGSFTFTTTLQSSGASTTGIEVPDEVIAGLGAGRRPPVAVTIGEHTYRNTVAVMGGKHLVSVSAEHRRLAKVAAGDEITVTLRLETAPRAVDVPEDFTAAMWTSSTRTFFDGLSNSLQRYHIDNINGAKTQETRQRRIDRAIETFRAGRRR